VLNGILFPNRQRGAIRLENYDPGRNRNGLRVLGRFIDRNVDLAAARRNRLMEIYVVVDGAQQHWLRPDAGIFDRELSLTIGLGIRDRLHRALQLQQNQRHAGGWLAGSAILNGSVNGSCMRRVCECKADGNASGYELYGSPHEALR